MNEKHNKNGSIKTIRGGMFGTTHFICFFRWRRIYSKAIAFLQYQTIHRLKLRGFQTCALRKMQVNEMKTDQLIYQIKTAISMEAIA